MSPCRIPATKVVKVAASPTPAARPSIPSIRLKAFEHRINQAAVNRKLHQGVVAWPPTARMRTPAA